MRIDIYLIRGPYPGYFNEIRRYNNIYSELGILDSGLPTAGITV